MSPSYGLRVAVGDVHDAEHAEQRAPPSRRPGGRPGRCVSGSRRLRQATKHEQQRDEPADQADRAGDDGAGGVARRRRAAATRRRRRRRRRARTGTARRRRGGARARGRGRCARSGVRRRRRRGRRPSQHGRPRPRPSAVNTRATGAGPVAHRARCGALACGAGTLARAGRGLRSVLLPVDRDREVEPPCPDLRAEAALAARRRRGRRTGRHAGESTPNTSRVTRVTRRSGSCRVSRRARRAPGRAGLEEEPAAFSSSGTRSRKVLPLPSSEATRISPPCIWAMRREIARPSPVPGIESACGVARAVEGREEVRLVGARDAEAGVGAQHVGVLARRCRPAGRRGPGKGVLDGVAGQVVDDLAELVGVGGHHDGSSGISSVIVTEPCSACMAISSRLCSASLRRSTGTRTLSRLSWIWE